jgi:hypothetical protein
MRGFSFWACLAALSLAAGAPAQTYTIQLKSGPDVGKSAVIKDSDSNDMVTNVSDGAGKLIRDVKQTEKHDETYTETILARGDKSATKYKRTYEKATRTRDGKTEARSYQGRTLHFEQKDGKFTVTAEGDKPLAKEDLDELTKKANEGDDRHEELFLPGKPVRVGDSWKVGGKELGQAFAKGGKVDVERTGAEVKLAKVYQKDGRQFGTIEMTLKVVPADLPPEIKFDKPPVVEMKITLDAAIDGSTTEGKMTMAGKMVSKSTAEQMGMKFVVETTADLSGTRELTAERCGCPILFAPLRRRVRPPTLRRRDAKRT